MRVLVVAHDLGRPDVDLRDLPALRAAPKECRFIRGSHTVREYRGTSQSTTRNSRTGYAARQRQSPGWIPTLDSRTAPVRGEGPLQSRSSVKRRSRASADETTRTQARNRSAVPTGDRRRVLTGPVVRVKPFHYPNGCSSGKGIPRSRSPERRRERHRGLRPDFSSPTARGPPSPAASKTRRTPSPSYLGRRRLATAPPVLRRTRSGFASVQWTRCLDGCHSPSDCSQARARARHSLRPRSARLRRLRSG